METLKNMELINREKLIRDIEDYFPILDKPSDFSVSHRTFIAINKLLKNYLDQGYPRKELIDHLSEYYSELQKQGKEKEEDLILECLLCFDHYSSEEWWL